MSGVQKRNIPVLVLRHNAAVSVSFLILTDYQEVAPGIILHYGADGHVVAVEILHAEKILGRAALMGIPPLTEPVAKQDTDREAPRLVFVMGRKGLMHTGQRRVM